METNVIYNEDCLGENGMKRLPDDSIDMILADLPYGTTQNKWDSVIPLEPLWEEYKRVIKENGAIALTAQAPFDKRLAMSNIDWFRYDWIWRKDSGTGFLNANRMPLKIHENVLIFYKKLPKYNPQMRKGETYTQSYSKENLSSSNYGDTSNEKTVEKTYDERYPITIVEFKRDSGKHPTQKPVELFKYMIKTYTDEGEVVLDNVIGSGTTAVACEKTNRKYIGFEKDRKYYEIAQERVSEVQKELI